MEKLSFYAVGDIGIHRDNPESALVHVAPTLRQADIAFCQLERALSEKGVAPDIQRERSRVSPNMVSASGLVGFHPEYSRVPPNMVSALTFAGFHVVSLCCSYESLEYISAPRISAGDTRGQDTYLP